MKSVASFILEENTKFTSLAVLDQSRVTAGDSQGNIHIFDSENLGKKSSNNLTEKKCVTDHCWVSSTHLCFTSECNAYIYDFNKQITIDTFIGHKQVIT